jgi:hypothetical protein
MSRRSLARTTNFVSGVRVNIKEKEPFRLAHFKIIGDWCNGSTTLSESVCQGSNPWPPAIFIPESYSSSMPSCYLGRGGAVPSSGANFPKTISTLQASKVRKSAGDRCSPMSESVSFGWKGLREFISALVANGAAGVKDSLQVRSPTAEDIFLASLVRIGTGESICIPL